MIEINNLSFEVKERKILDDINFEIKDNEMNFIIGRSGSGKTTLLQILGGLQKQTSGSILKEGEELSNGELSRNVAFIFQNFALINNMKAKDNILLSLEKITKEDKSYLEELSDKLEISHVLNSKVKSLSGGEKQRVAIARALITNKEYLLCDEPTGNLDYQTALNIMKLIRSLNKTVIMVTHDKSLITEEDNVLEIF